MHRSPEQIYEGRVAALYGCVEEIYEERVACLCGCVEQREGSQKSGPEQIYEGEVAFLVVWCGLMVVSWAKWLLGGSNG